MTTPIKTYDCEGCSPFCYGGYHMEEIADGYGDWVRKEDHDSVVKAAIGLLREVAALKRYGLEHHSSGKGRSSVTINVPRELIAQIDAALAEQPKEA